MPNHVLQLDCNFGSTGLVADLGTPAVDVWVTLDVSLNASALAWLNGQGFAALFASVYDATEANAVQLVFTPTALTSGFGWNDTNTAFGDFADTLAALQFYRIEMHCTAGSPMGLHVYVDGVSFGTLTTSVNVTGFQHYELDAISGGGAPGGSYVYIDNYKVGTTRGGSDLFNDDFEGSLPGGWNEAYQPLCASIVVDPGITPTTGGGGGGGGGAGRVFIAFDDGPLVASPTYTRIDGGDAPFPESFVAEYEITCGRQSLLSQTDTGTATVAINDHEFALFDPRNVSSPYHGKLDGRQILLQLYDPVRAVWESQFQGHIDNVLYDVDGSGVDQNGDPINVAIKLECVDIFDFLAGYGLTPGLDGVIPPAGAEDGVYYAETVGSVDDRIIEILADVGIDSTRYLVASGNVRVIAVKYDPDESALVALRDACDAEFPFIANMYVDRRGMFSFRGRGSRFDPDVVAAEPGSTWDFHRWAVGDGNAIIADATRAQMRVLSYGRGRRDVINAAIAYPQNISAADMPGQVFADTASITAYGKHQAQPMSDLLTLNGTVTGNNAKQETFLFAKLLVENQKDPREAVSSLQLKAIRPDDPRAAATWALITQADISHIVNVAVGYPSGTGFTGASPDDDYYIEGRHLRVTPLNGDHDYVELDLEVSPAVWSMDTHSVFPPSEPGAETPTVLTAGFTTA